MKDYQFPLLMIYWPDDGYCTGDPEYYHIRDRVQLFEECLTLAKRIMSPLTKQEIREEAMALKKMEKISSYPAPAESDPEYVHKAYQQEQSDFYFWQKTQDRVRTKRLQMEAIEQGHGHAALYYLEMKSGVEFVQFKNIKY